MNRIRNSDKIEIFIVVIVMLSVVVAISGMSFARYTTSGTGGANSARVAKWGFVIDVDAEDLFAPVGGSSEDVALTSDGDGLSLDSVGSAILPNAGGALTFSVSGTAEVAAEITFSLPSEAEIICLKTGEDEIIYSPIRWTLTKNGEEVVTGGDLTAIREALPAMTVPAGQEVRDSYVLTWKWPPEWGEDEQEREENNAFDTMLAKYMADPYENPLPEGYVAVLSFRFHMTIDVSQTHDPS